MVPKERVLAEGHEIAEMISSASNPSDLENMKDKIAAYTDFVDENFGTAGDPDEEKESQLSLMLYVAVGWKRSALENGNKDTLRLAEKYLTEFKDYLESGDWVKNSSSEI